NGSFKDMAMQVFKHSSQSAMGNDIADLNNDGLGDIITVDMLPRDNYRRKKNMGGNNYYLYQSMSAAGLLYQYTRNTLQLHNGLIPAKDGNQIPSYSEIAFFAGVAETDWSWSPLAADFDNDGYRDLLITNGYPKDVTDQDFGAYSYTAGNKSTKQELLAMIPQVKIANYAYQNSGALKFLDVTNSWGMHTPSFSTGAAYADLDNDGDLDYIVNNINDKAFVYRNNQQQLAPKNYLQISLEGDSLNRRGLGAIISLYVGDQKIITENYPYRGYLSSVSTIIHVGLGAISQVDSITIQWTNGYKQTLLKPGINQLITARQDTFNRSDSIRSLSAKIPPDPARAQVQDHRHDPLLKQLTSGQLGLDYVHTEYDFIDFDIQPMLPHKLSEYNPCLAVADLDGNGT
ncbi:MAG: CRTAC1 family protein, partial [Sphingobacteriales bacterium]